MKKNVTIIEIAEKSGVSVSTVSRVLNNSPSVSDKKRKKIQAVIDELGYQPSVFARGMISKKTNTLAIVVPDITNPYFTSLIVEIERYSKEIGYSLLLFNTMTAGSNKFIDTSFKEATAFKTIIEKQVDGVLILGGEIDKEQPHNDYLTALNQLNQQIPVVIIGQKQENCDCLFVERDLDKGVTTLTQHLLALGHRKIGFIGGESGVKVTTQRVEAFKKTLSIYSEVDESLIVLNDYYVEDGYTGMQKLLANQDNLPTAVVAINDTVAIGVLRALTDANYHTPRDIAVASCDRFPNSEFQIPRITTIDQHNDYLGKASVMKLISAIQSENENSMIQHSPELIIRESCGAKFKGE